MTLNKLNSLATQAAVQWFQQMCAATSWCEKMVAARPYTSNIQLERQAELAWQVMEQDDVLQALAAHPMIGDINSLRTKYANTKKLAAGEQSGMQVARDDELERISMLNQQYLARHGFIFIICASGLSAQQMLSELEIRLPNSTEQELTIAATEQIKITLLRMNNALQATHAMDKKYQ